MDLRNPYLKHTTSYTLTGFILHYVLNVVLLRDISENRDWIILTEYRHLYLS